MPEFANDGRLVSRPRLSASFWQDWDRAPAAGLDPRLHLIAIALIVVGLAALAWELWR
jgi:hypothetical protein